MTLKFHAFEELTERTEKAGNLFSVKDNLPSYELHVCHVQIHILQSWGSLEYDF